MDSFVNCPRAFNQLQQYVVSTGNMAYCYAELADSFLAVAITMASTHFSYPEDDQAELAWVFWLKARQYTQEGHPSQY